MTNDHPLRHERLRPLQGTDVIARTKYYATLDDNALDLTRDELLNEQASQEAIILTARFRADLLSQLAEEVRHLQRDREKARSFTCPECGMVSYHPEDIRNGYCGNCHKFTGAEL